MPIQELLSCFLQDNFNKLSQIERFYLETYLFMHLLEKLLQPFRTQYKDYLHLLKNQPYKEDEMIEINFLRIFVNDILSTGEYTIEGIANAVRMPVDVIVEIGSGINTDPSLKLGLRVIKLHCDVRRELYSDLMKKLINGYAV